MRNGQRVGVAGPGLIGGSIALRARALGACIVAWDRDEVNLRDAVALGIVDETASTFDELARACDVLVLAGPVHATLAQIEALVGTPSSAGLVLDVASVKTAIARAGTPLRDFVATHPIAGSERGGAAAARADLFDGKVWMLDSAAAPAARERAEAFVRALGARPIAMDPAEHDRLIALTSHVPQLLSVALGARLAERVDEPGVVDLCGTGIASMLRLGASSWQVWQPILDANAETLAQEVRALATILIDAATALENGRTSDLESDFRSSARAVARLVPRSRTAKAEEA